MIGVAWTVKLGPDVGQVRYRRLMGAGCGIGHLHGPEPGLDQVEREGQEADWQVGYRMEAEERPLVWVGRGLAEFGITPGTALASEEDMEAADALMDGRDPRTGEQLVDPKVEVAPIAKLPALPFVTALVAAGVEHGLQAGAPARELLSIGGREPGGKAVKRLERIGRGIEREGEAHAISINDLEWLADLAGLDLSEVYPEGKLAAARNNRHERVRIGNRGYDLTLDLPKSLSVLYGLAEGELAAGIEDVYTAAVHETVAAVEDWVAYGLRGHHGDGRQAERIETSGLAGWIMWHAVARPVDGQAPDPHWHAHVVLANMARGLDGKWSAIGAGGTDLHRHTHAADALLKARIRYELTKTYGIAWEHNPETGAWEIAAILAELRQHFSKRDGADQAGLRRARPGL